MLRLLTYNIHGCVGRHGRVDPGAVLETIANSGADVVALQEVIDDGSDFLRDLEALGFRKIVFSPMLNKPSGVYGILMMSRREPTETQVIDLNLGGIEPRGAIRFHLDLPSGRLDVCGTHLGLSASERMRQISRLDLTLADADERHDDTLQVLMGDLNEWRPRTRFMATVRKRFQWVSRNPTFPARRPVIALDRIAVRGSMRPIRFLRLDAPPANFASDHRPLMAEIEL